MQHTPVEFVDCLGAAVLPKLESLFSLPELTVASDCFSLASGVLRQVFSHLTWPSTLASLIGIGLQNRTSVIIDFSGQLKGLEGSAVAYSDLSVEGDTDEAAEGLFRALRWADTQPSAQRLLIAGMCCQASAAVARVFVS